MRWGLCVLRLTFASRPFDAMTSFVGSDPSPLPSPPFPSILLSPLLESPGLSPLPL